MKKQLGFEKSCDTLFSKNTYSSHGSGELSPMRITQQDIAKLAQVSQATVSRVVAGDEKVEPSIRKRVADVMSENNYRPDVRARSLRGKKTGLIGLVIKRPPGGLSFDPFFARLTAEILDYLSGREYHLCLDTVLSEFGHEAIYDEMLRTRRVDGLILVESETRDERIERLRADQFPFVLIGNPLDRLVHSVDNDNEFAGHIAATHLVEGGYRKIGFLAGRPGVTVSDDRIAGYSRAMSLAGAAPLVFHSDFGSDAANKTAREVLASPDRPDALVVLDDFMAMGVVLAARAAHLRIPEDLGVVSFNDTPLCDLLECGLTSVSLNIAMIVQRACNRLLRIVEGRAIEAEARTIVPCELMVRGSSRRPIGAASI